MKEIFNIFKYTKFLLVFITSIVVYMIFLLPSKYFLFALGYEIRISVMFPIIFGILFGPIGAISVSIGSLILNLLIKSQIFLNSNNIIVDFIATFMFSYISFLIWNGIGNKTAILDKGLKYTKIIKVIVVSSLFNAFISAYGLMLFNIGDFKKIILIITINNLVLGLMLCIPIYLLIYPFLKKHSLLYEDILNNFEIKPTFKESAWVFILIILIIASYCICILLSFTNFNGILYYLLNIKLIGALFLLVDIYMMYLINKTRIDNR